MVKMMLDKYAQSLEVDKYKDYNGQTTREVIEQKLPELSEKLPKRESDQIKSENWEVNTQDLKYYLNDGDEAKFLKCMKVIQEEIPLYIAENLLTISAQHNFQQTVTAILKKFKGRHLNLRKAACAAVQTGHHIIFEELLKVESKLVNDLLLYVCLELGIPGKQGSDNLLKCLEFILKQNNVNVRCTDSEYIVIKCYE